MKATQVCGDRRRHGLEPREVADQRRKARSAIEFFKLSTNRVLELGSDVEI